VLARYMQVLSPEFVVRYRQRIINVHHSFSGVQRRAPYQAAYHRGVKLIGATSHYVTEVLDDGPIIEQDVVRVSQPRPGKRPGPKGRDLERDGALARRALAPWSTGFCTTPARPWCSTSGSASNSGPVSGLLNPA